MIVEDVYKRQLMLSTMLAAVSIAVTVIQSTGLRLRRSVIIVIIPFVFVFALSRRKIVAAHYNHVLTRHLLLEMLKSVERLVQCLVLLGKV